MVMGSDADEYEYQRKKKAGKEGYNYRPLLNGSQLIPATIENNLMLMCLKLSKSVINAKKLYNRMDIVELWRLSALKSAADYKDPFADSNERQEWT